MIRKKSRKGKPPIWVLYSRGGDKILGHFSSRQEAEEREKEIEYFKSQIKK